jgi:hypothetical protein
MVHIPELWLPILLSSVIVFIASSIIHMALKYHDNDYRKLPDEAAAADALRKLNIPPGQYILPRASNMKEMNSPEHIEKLKRGPVGIVHIWPSGKPEMAKYLVQWFIYVLVVGVFSAYVAGRALGAGSHYLAVFRFVGVTAFCCYVVGGLQESIWWRRPLSMTLKNSIDGLLFALLTAGTFGWLWPR